LLINLGLPNFNSSGVKNMGYKIPSLVVWHGGQVCQKDRYKLVNQQPVTLWLTGLSASGKSTLAYALERALINLEHLCYVLDGDNVRHGLNRNLGFSHEDRTENIRRVAEVARLMNDSGLIVITAFISPFRMDRAAAGNIIGLDCFKEVHVSTPLSVCEIRDPKGLYNKARAGNITDFTGISSPYEEPESPDLVIDTSQLSLEKAVSQLVSLALQHQV
jgi:adenylylsulfate kinase